MTFDKNKAEDFYRSDDYISQHPTLHASESPWKVSKIIPLIDRVLDKQTINSTIRILDVGGGAGTILKSIGDYILSKGRKIEKYALDLSPGMLSLQQQTNPDIVKLLNENITGTSLRDKEITLVLMIDVLEHIPDQVKALQEINRISDYAIFKVPLGDFLVDNIINSLTQGRLRQKYGEIYGHVNFYDTQALLTVIRQNLGPIVHYYYTNVYEYNLNSGQKVSLLRRIAHLLGYNLNKISPAFAASILMDFLMVLAQSDDK